MPGGRVQGIYDVAVAGGGVVGAAVTRGLSGGNLRVALLEGAPDVGTGTSKANTGIWHCGFDAPPGSLEARLLRRAYPLVARFAAEAGIPLERPGAILVAWSPEQVGGLEHVRAKAQANGVTDLAPLTRQAVLAMEPQLGPGVLGGLLVPGEGILCPAALTLALASEAVTWGATLLTRHRVTAWHRQEGVHVLTTPSGEVRARWLVNTAGLHADALDAMLGHRRLTITPRKGELVVLDKAARKLLRHVILPVPDATTKGVLVSPTVFGNVLVGPTAQDTQDKANRATTGPGLASLLERARAILPALAGVEVTATYAGLRTVANTPDYAIDVDGTSHYVLVGGIRSTGVSAALGIAEHVVEQVQGAGLRLTRRPDLPRWRAPPTGEAQPRPYRDNDAIRSRPAHGEVVCHCQQVTRGELEDAMEGPVPATTMDGLRRRTRCMQGRCQGFHCQALVAAMLARRTGRTVDDVLALGGA
jgi:glycerol-3-phosphate dehydrogenase